ncbi:hypothetical protein MTO96_037128 [Rhipicephalus appendiculatus]
MNPQREALVGCGIAGPAIPRAPRCVVPVCHSRVAPSSILYPLPSVPSQRQAWIDFVRACPCGGARDWDPPTGEISLVCSLHFTVSCFRFQRTRGCSSVVRNKLQTSNFKHLKNGAVPTLYPIEEQCDLAANKDSPDNTAEDSCSSDVTSVRRRDSWASSRSIAGQDGGHRKRKRKAAQRNAHRAAVEIVFPKDASTQCSLEMASKTTSYNVRTVSKSVQCNG